MSKETFPIKRSCPECGKEALARAEEPNGFAHLDGDRSVRLIERPKGFRVVDNDAQVGGADFICDDCEVVAT